MKGLGQISTDLLVEAWAVYIADQWISRDYSVKHRTASIVDSGFVHRGLPEFLAAPPIDPQAASVTHTLWHFWIIINKWLHMQLGHLNVLRDCQ